jgi:hypothetical protein
MIATLLAQITNPALPGGLQNASSANAAGAGLAKYIGILWQTALVMGGIAVLAYMIMGGLTWIMAAGDKGKVEQAKERITQGLIGLAVLFSVGAISVFFGTALGIDLLKPNFASIMGAAGGSTGGGGGGGGGSSLSSTSDCGNGMNIGDKGSDGGTGGYCTSGPATMKCVAAGVGPSKFSYPHLEPCACPSGQVKSGYTLLPGGC